MKGEFVLILGTSGGGKSSILNIVGTIDTPSSGNLELFGELMRRVTSDSEYARIRLEKIGFVFQSFNLISSMTAIENVELPMLLKGELSKSDIRKRAKKLLNDVNLGDRMFHYPNMLSGGEQQRVTIARALSNKPTLLLLDEPTGDLDTRNGDNVMHILLNLKRTQGITMIMITHDEYMKSYADRVLHIMDGKITDTQTITKEIQEESFQNLEKRVMEARLNKDGTGVREGAEAGEIHGLTQRRNPSDYAFYKKMIDESKNR